MRRYSFHSLSLGFSFSHSFHKCMSHWTRFSFTPYRHMPHHYSVSLQCVDGISRCIQLRIQAALHVLARVLRHQLRHGALYNRVVRGSDFFNPSQPNQTTDSIKPNPSQSKNFGPANQPNPQLITQSKSIQPTTNLRAKERQF